MHRKMRILNVFFCSWAAFVLFCWAIQMIFFFCYWRDSFSLSRRHKNDFFHITCVPSINHLFLDSCHRCHRRLRYCLQAFGWHFHLFHSTHTHTHIGRETNSSISFALSFICQKEPFHCISLIGYGFTWSDEVTVASNFLVHTYTFHVYLIDSIRHLCVVAFVATGMGMGCTEDWFGSSKL